jgi:hypothetical protein
MWTYNWGDVELRDVELRNTFWALGRTEHERAVTIIMFMLSVCPLLTAERPKCQETNL